VCVSAMCVVGGCGFGGWVVVGGWVGVWHVYVVYVMFVCVWRGGCGNWGECMWVLAILNDHTSR
jgi:hypothetical protein